MQAFQFAIVAGVEAFIGGVVVHLQQIHRQIHLVRAGLAAGHVEFQAHVLKLLVLCFQRSFLCGQLVTIHCQVISHNQSPPISFSHTLYPLYFDTAHA